MHEMTMILIAERISVRQILVLLSPLYVYIYMSATDVDAPHKAL